MDTSIVILHWNNYSLIRSCLESIRRARGDLELEIIVVDNASTDGSPTMICQDFPEVRLISNKENMGFARGNNLGVKVSQGRYVLLLNSDAQLTSGALQAMIALMEAQPKAGVVGAQLRNPDGSFQASHTPFPNLLQEFLILSGLGRLLLRRSYPSRGPEEDKGPQKVDYVEGACLLVRREAFEQVGGFDEGYFMYAEEVDLCYTLQKVGWEVWYLPDARVIHLGGGSSHNRRPQREADLYRSQVRFFRKHYGDVTAFLLKMQIITLTFVKVLIHAILRWFSRGRRGRVVVSLPCLLSALKGV